MFVCVRVSVAFHLPCQRERARAREREGVREMYSEPMSITTPPTHTRAHRHTPRSTACTGSDSTVPCHKSASSWEQKGVGKRRTEGGGGGSGRQEYTWHDMMHGHSAREREKERERERERKRAKERERETLSGNNVYNEATLLFVCFMLAHMRVLLCGIHSTKLKDSFN